MTKKLTNSVEGFYTDFTITPKKCHHVKIFPFGLSISCAITTFTPEVTCIFQMFTPDVTISVVEKRNYSQDINILQFMKIFRIINLSLKINLPEI